MFIILDKEVQKDIKCGLMGVDELARYFSRTLTIEQLAKNYAELYLSTAPTKEQITVTEEEMAKILSLFKVRGKKADGTEETRGRKKLTKD